MSREQAESSEDIQQIKGQAINSVLGMQLKRKAYKKLKEGLLCHINQHPGTVEQLQTETVVLSSHQ